MKSKKLITRLMKVVKGNHWELDEKWAPRSEHYYFRPWWFKKYRKDIDRRFTDDLPF